MIATEPQIALTGRYSVKQTCDALGIGRSTLHRYTQSGAIRSGRRKNVARNTPQRFYLGSEILRFWKATM